MKNVFEKSTGFSKKLNLLHFILFYFLYRREERTEGWQREVVGGRWCYDGKRLGRHSKHESRGIDLFRNLLVLSLVIVECDGWCITYDTLQKQKKKFTGPISSNFLLVR